MQIKVNDQFDFDMSQSIEDADIIQNSDGTYHMLLNDKSYSVIPKSFDFKSKKLTLELDKRDFHVSVKDDFDVLIKKLGFSLNTIHKVKEIKAPMPGLVLEIIVSPGQEVEEGAPLLILEAMKMENVIKSPGTGVVKIVHVNIKDAIEKGTVMIEME